MALLPRDSKDQRFMIAGIAPLALIFAYYQYVQTPRGEQTATLRTHVESLETRNATARTIEQQQGGPRLEARVAALEQHVAQLERLVPRKEEVPLLLRDLSLRARDTRLQLTRLKPETEEAGEYYVKRTYEINVQGSYHAIGTFLGEVGSLSRIMTPIDLKLMSNTGKTARDGGPILNGNFRLLTYIVPPHGEAPADHLSVNIVNMLAAEPANADAAVRLDAAGPATLDTIAVISPDSLPSPVPDSVRASAVPDTIARNQNQT